MNFGGKNDDLVPQSIVFPFESENNIPHKEVTISHFR